MKNTNEPQRRLGKAMLFLLLAMCFLLPPAALDAAGPAVSPSDAAPPKPPANETPAKTGLIQEGNYFVLYIEGTPVTERGWTELKKQKFFIDDSGHATAKMELSGNVWRFFKYDADSSSWKNSGISGRALPRSYTILISPGTAPKYMMRKQGS